MKSNFWASNMLKEEDISSDHVFDNLPLSSQYVVKTEDEIKYGWIVGVSPGHSD